MRTALHLRSINILALLLLCQISFASHSEVGTPTYTSYTPDNHRGGGISTEICEAPDGNIFAGNEAGLLRYNGVNWSLMPSTGKASYIMSVAIDSNNQIWVLGLKTIGYYSANENGYYIYQDVTSSLEQLPEHSKLGTFWKLFTHEQYVYLITSNDVLRWDGFAWKNWSFQDQRRILPSWSNGSLYIHARGTGLFRFDNEDFKLIAQDTPNVSSGIMSVIQITPETLLCATHSNGLFYLEEGYYKRLPTKIEVSDIIHATLDQNGHIILSTTELGILIISQSGELINQIFHHKSPCYYTLEDSTGSLWAATTGALLNIPNITLSKYSENAHDIIRHQNTLYYTNRAKLKSITGPRHTESDLVQTHLETTALWDLHSIGTDLLYGDSKSLGVISSTKETTKIPSPRHVAYLFPNWNDSTLIYSSDAPKISRWKNTTSGWEHLDSHPQFNSRAISLVELPNSQILVSTESSPLQLATWPLPGSNSQHEPTITSLGQEHGLPDKFIWAHCLRIEDWVVVISDKGLYRYDKETELFHYDPILGDDLGTDAYGLESCPAADNDGWILRLPTTGQNQNVIGHLSTSDGEQFEWRTLQLPSLHLAGKVEALLHEKIDGLEILWAGGSKDLLRYDLTNMPEHPAPRTRLTAIREQDAQQTYFGGAGAPPASFKWEFPQKTIRIEYAAAPSPIQVAGYQTRLTGFDQDWSKSSNITFKDFTNLSPGSYEFEVRAVDEFGRFGTSANLSFSILPPWYQTVYAYVGYAAVFIASLYIASRWRLRALRIKNERLEDLIHERTVELQEQQLQLIKANNAKQDFLASMSHEIRNPLNGILGIVNLMHEREKQSGISTPQTTHLFTSANHLHQLLGQTLDYSSLEAGKLRTRIEPFEACKLIDQVVDMHLNMAKQKGLSLHSQKPDAPCHWKGDPVLLRQVLINLVSNAVKYTTNGFVNLALCFERGEDSISARFEVTDTGPGIPKDQEDYIFEEFTRLSKPGESEIPGTGLGLAIAAKVSTIMGGRLRLDSSYTDGARFYLEIEFEEDLYTQASNKRQEDNSEILTGRRVLIADDIDFNRYITTELLKAMGASVDSAVNGEDALMQVHESSYDIVILDINMPILSGLEVVESFFESEPDRKAPEFIALSAYNTKEMEIKCLNVGFEHFIEKPLDPTKLIRLFGKRYKSPSNPKSIIDYIAGDNAQAKAELRNSFQKSFNTELQLLQEALTEGNQLQLSEIVHKLIGMASIREDKELIALLQQLSKLIKQSTTESQIRQLLGKIEAVVNG